MDYQLLVYIFDSFLFTFCLLVAEAEVVKRSQLHRQAPPVAHQALPIAQQAPTVAQQALPATAQAHQRQQITRNFQIKAV